MPFILAGLALIAAGVYYACQLYWLISRHFGALAGLAAVGACVALLAGAVIHAWRRYRALHGVKIQGERILALRESWGVLNLDAEHKRGDISLDGQSTGFIFADLDPPTVTETEHGWILTVKLRHNARAEWPLPLSNATLAKRWAKILTLAIHQKL